MSRLFPKKRGKHEIYKNGRTTKTGVPESGVVIQARQYLRVEGAAMSLANDRDLTDSQWEILDDLILNQRLAKMDVDDRGKIDVMS
jgi:hypothetical protein